jgi:hypothetical protein
MTQQFLVELEQIESIQGIQLLALVLVVMASPLVILVRPASWQESLQLLFLVLAFLRPPWCQRVCR